MSQLVRRALWVAVVIGACAGGGSAAAETAVKHAKDPDKPGQFSFALNLENQDSLNAIIIFIFYFIFFYQLLEQNLNAVYHAYPMLLCYCKKYFSAFFIPI
jgi:hypothetical protein